MSKALLKSEQNWIGVFCTRPNFSHKFYFEYRAQMVKYTNSVYMNGLIYEKSSIFWDIPPRSMAKVNRRFGEHTFFRSEQ
jgi:hypothetical protein